MSKKKILVMLAALLLVFAAASAAQAAAAPLFETTLAPDAGNVHLSAPPPQPANQEPTPAPQPPVAVLKVVAVPANPADKNAITSTIQVVTDTTVGPKPAMVTMGTSGLTNVPINVPVFLAVSAADPNNSGTPTWTLTAPQGSKATFKDAAAVETQFTPDVDGAYKVDVVLKNAAGLSSALQSVTFHASTYIGMTAGNCMQCHPSKVDEWSKTGHATIFSDEIDNKKTPDVDTHYTEACARCHTVGYFAPPANNGGFKDAMAATNWNLPTWAQINAAGKGGPSNWDAAPAEVKNMGNIQCENCHGPATDHVKNGAPVMAVSFDNGVCDVCHAGGGHHVKGIEITYSAHSDANAEAWNVPTGPAEQLCVRCHTARGYASFTANPTNPAAWDNNKQTLGCAGCHDPHNDTNYAQLRVVGTPVQVPFDAKDVGLSATCETCHNNRTKPEDATKGSYPHYSSAAEMLDDTGGVTYGATVPNSPHAAVVGTAPIQNPAFAKDPTTNQFLFSAVGDAKGNVPGPCVTCHMTSGIADAKDPNYLKVGEHSFNTVSPDGYDYTAACKTCHGDLTTFDFPAKADYDGNGKVEGVQTEVGGLLDVLWTDLQAKGLTKIDSGYPYANVPKDADDHVKNAWYNFRYVYGTMWGTAGPGNHGKAAAIHNFQRSVGLLQLSVKDLTGSLPAGMTDITQ